MRGLIIYFDGPDGVGKTTQLKLAASKLIETGHEVYVSRTLGGTPIGELLREAMLSPNPRPVETDLHIALASQHALAKDVLPKREKQQIVLIDRSPLSIVAYQVFGDGLDPDKGYEAARELLSLVKPDLILAYTASLDILKERRGQRNHLSTADYFESKPLEYHQNVTRGFEEAISRFGARAIDAEASEATVHQATMDQILALLKA